MSIRTLSLALAGTAALALSACGDPAEDDLADVEPMPVETLSSTVMDNDPMARDYTLTSEQQGRRDSFDEDAFDTEYSGIAESNSGTVDRSTMTYEDADRNSDGRLSAAEYAYYGSSGLASLTEPQKRRLIDAFYYYDADGDGVISSSEFGSMNNGSGVSTGSVAAGTGMNTMEGGLDDGDTAVDATTSATTNSVNDKRAN